MAEGELGNSRSTEEGAAYGAGFGRGFLYGLWYFAALSHSLKPGRLKRSEILGEPVLLGRNRGGQVFALRDICPHRAAPLSGGRLVGAGAEESVQCPYHGWSFRTQDGGCQNIPSLVDGQDLDLDRIRVRSYPVQESQGLVWIFMAENARAPGPTGPPPLIEGAVGGKPKMVEQLMFESHVDRAVIGLIDPAHGPYVHHQWWWRSSHKQLEKAKRFVPSELGFVMTRHEPSKNSRAYKILGGAPETEITFRLPALRWEHVKIGQSQLLALTCLTPVGAEQTRLTQIIWSDHWVVALLRPIIKIAARRFLRQDGDMVSLQNEGLRYGPALLLVDDADRQAKWYQALKKAWALARRDGSAFVNPVEPTVLRWRS